MTEYKVVTLIGNDSERTKQLNELAKEGWKVDKPLTEDKVLLVKDGGGISRIARWEFK